MRDLLLVTQVEFTRAGPRDIEAGLLGFATVQLGSAIELGCIAVRRTQAGALFLKFPTRLGSNGRRRRVARILDDAEREAVEVQVIAVLRARGAIR